MTRRRAWTSLPCSVVLWWCPPSYCITTYMNGVKTSELTSDSQRLQPTSSVTWHWLNGSQDHRSSVDYVDYAGLLIKDALCYDYDELRFLGPDRTRTYALTPHPPKKKTLITDHRSLHKLPTIVGTEATLPFLLKLRIHQACDLFQNFIILEFPDSYSWHKLAIYILKHTLFEKLLHFEQSFLSRS